jgi:hypothetical protein
MSFRFPVPGFQALNFQAANYLADMRTQGPATGIR